MLRPLFACTTGRPPVWPRAIHPARRASLARAKFVTPIRGAADEAAQAEAVAATYRVSIKQPLGLVLAASSDGRVFVEEIKPGSNADKVGGIMVGDVVTGCSAVTLKESKSGLYSTQGHGARPYDNFDEIWVDTRNLQFDTVMSALSSNNRASSPRGSRPLSSPSLASSHLSLSLSLSLSFCPSHSPDTRSPDLQHDGG